MGAVVELNDKLAADKGPWIDVINKLTGLDKAVAAEALNNATPDAAIHRPQTLAIEGEARLPTKH